MISKRIMIIERCTVVFISAYELAVTMLYFTGIVLIKVEEIKS